MGKRSSKRLEEALQGIPSPEAEKIRVEVRKLKIEMTLAVLTAVGAVLAFLVTNAGALLGLLPNPSLTVLTADELLAKAGELAILGDDGKAKFQGPVEDGSQGVRLPPGIYDVVVKLGERVILKKRATLQY